MADRIDVDRIVRALGATARDAMRDLANQVARIRVDDVAAQLGELAADLAREIGPVLLEMAAELGRQARSEVPANWWNLTPPQIFAVIELMKDTGWNLVHTPPSHDLRRLLQAPTEAERRQVLLTAEPIILNELDQLNDAAIHPEYADLRRVSREALESYRSGYTVAAQALSIAALGSIVHSELGHSKFSEAREALNAISVEEKGLRLIRYAALMGALARALERHYPGDPPAPRLNRHASAHGIDSLQYTELNSLTSVMLVVGITHELSGLRTVIEQAPPTPKQPRRRDPS